MRYPTTQAGRLRYRAMNDVDPPEEKPVTRITFGKHVGGRSAEFDAYVRAQSPERRAEIEAQERQYLENRGEVDERALTECMQGLEDAPAGHRPTRALRQGFDY